MKFQKSTRIEDDWWEDSSRWLFLGHEYRYAPAFSSVSLGISRTSLVIQGVRRESRLNKECPRVQGTGLALHAEINSWHPRNSSKDPVSLRNPDLGEEFQQNHDQILQVLMLPTFEGFESTRIHGFRIVVSIDK